MTARPAQFDDLILMIHSAALAEEGWIRIGNDLSRALGADGASLVKPSGHAAFKPWCRLFEFDAAFMREYAEQWGPHDVWYQGAVRTQRTGVGVVNVDGHLIDYREYKRTPFYNEFLRRMNVDRMMNVCVSGPQSDRSYGPLAMSFYRGPGKESFSTQDAALLSRLAPHLTVAAENYWAAQALRLLARAHGEALDTLTSAVFAVEASAQVAFANHLGQEILRQKHWVQVCEGALGPAPGVMDAPSMARALRQLSRGISFQLIATDRVGGAQAIIRGAPIPPSEPDVYSPRVTAFVWVTPVIPPVDVSADLARLFGLTPAERRLVARLIAGDALRDAALNLRISPHTARTQLKSVFTKTGRRSQTALLTLVTRLSALRTPTG